MKNRFIPIDNKIDKAIAFAPSLTKEFRDNNLIKQTKQDFIETTSVLQGLQEHGWQISGVCEHRGHNRKVNLHYVKLEHPDFKMYSKNKVEGVANMYVTNSCQGNRPLNIDFGMHRLVCSNGLVARTTAFEQNLKHNAETIRRIPVTLSKVNEAIQEVIKRYERLKQVELAPSHMDAFLSRAAALRFEDGRINPQQLLNINRTEDEGTDLWTIYNRVQENLIKSNMLVDKNGNLISGVENVATDIRLNRDLFELVEDFA